MTRRWYWQDGCDSCIQPRAATECSPGRKGLLPKKGNIGSLHVAVGFMPAFKHN